MIVEDNLPIRTLFKTVLTQSGYKVIAMNDAKSALDHYSNQTHLIISDVDMPGHDGVWLLEQVRKMNPQQKFILTSANQHSIRIKYAKEIGIQCFIEKPFSIKDFVKTVDQCVNDLIN